ncbi:MAG TPA: hypothetical protein VIK78_14820 [Ruminiclostridium sp.]
MTIKFIDIVHHSHTDFGFTDHPLKARELQKEYVGMALDIIKETSTKQLGEKFYWTAETLIPIYDWWKENEEEQRQELLEAVKSGQFGIMGMAFNVTSFLNEDEWDKVLNWIPEELWDKLKPIACMQNDINGMPTAAVMKAIKKGLNYMWIGPNTYNAVPPFATPSAFKWRMPDGNSMFVWLNSGYCDGYFMFNENWRQGPVPFASDLRYRKPEKDDVWRSDEKSVLEAHEKCLRNIKLLEGVVGDETSQKAAKDGFTLNRVYGGYENERLLVSVTGQWRVDNDPPFKSIIEFVSKWNQLELKPELRLTTADQAMKDLEKEIGYRLPERTGEWVDWWANGTTSSPVEVAISRKAKRILTAIKSPVFGEMSGEEQNYEDHILRNLCMFDEHTYGSWESIASPFAISTRIMAAEKNIYCYRAFADAESLLADRSRKDYNFLDYGIYVINSSSIATSGWVELPVNCLRGEYAYVRNTSNGEISQIYFDEGVESFRRPESPDHFSVENISYTFSDKVPRQKIRFWMGEVQPCSRVYFELLNLAEFEVTNKIFSVDENVVDRPQYILEKDQKGWPCSICWGSRKIPLFEEALGDFLSYEPQGFAPRWIMKDIFNTDDTKERMEKREKYLRIVQAEYKDMTQQEETAFTKSFYQTFSHPSLDFGYRKLTIYKNEPRIRLKIKISRKSSMQPEIFYLKFKLPCEGVIPRVSNGGNSFRPEIDQLQGSCMDYYAIDSWVHYKTKNGNWIWASADAPLITFEKPNAVARLEKLPQKTDQLLSMVFDNTWDTNFACDSHGIMEFNYDLVWKENIECNQIEQLVQGLTMEPVVMVKTRE